MNKIVKYVLISIIVILLIIGVIGLYKKFGGSAMDDSTKTKLVKHKHYEYKIPENWEYSQEDLYFELINSSEKGWNARISLIYDADNYLFDRHGVVTKDLRKDGYNFSEPEIKTKNGVKYLIYETACVNEKDEIENRLIAYVRSERQYVYEINIISKKEEYDYETLYKISKILLSGKFDNTDKTYSYYTYEYAEK